MNYFKHPQAIVEDGAKIGEDSRIWAWAHILNGATIGKDCNICDHVFIENGVTLGNRVTVKCGVYLWDGVSTQDDVFIGYNATFINDHFPRSKQYPEKYAKTYIGKGASIGANATIFPVTIGDNAMIGAGAVVTNNVPPYAIVVGNPGRIAGYVNTIKVNEVCNPISKSSVQSTETGAKIYNLKTASDIRGNLNVLEFEKDLPFPIKRMFYTYCVKSTAVRGEHAHKKCEQFLIAVHGSLHVIVDNAECREEFILDSPQKGLHLPAGCWGIQYRHSEDCVLLVLASEEYDADDYIRNYKEYEEYIKQK